MNVLHSNTKFQLSWTEARAMEDLLERLGCKEMCLIGLGICGVLVAMKSHDNYFVTERAEGKCWKLVDFEELVKMIRQHNIQLFDVREREEVASTGLIPLAVNVPCECSNIHLL